MVGVFDRYIGIDYSGAQAPVSSLKGLRVYAASPLSSPEEVPPPPSPRKYRSRLALAQWLLDQVNGEQRVLAGIDHGFSFPLKYFERHRLPFDWTQFLEDFQRHWPTDDKYTYVCFVRDKLHGNAAARKGDSHWRRLAEIRVGAKSVFHFDVPGQVATTTHAGLPWLLHIRKNANKPVHFWPFDGWEIPATASVVAEAYPALWSGSFPRDGRTSDQYDAYSVAASMQEADENGSLAAYFAPAPTSEEREIAEIEGWILGVR
jgi:hypothetical protein